MLLWVKHGDLPTTIGGIWWYNGDTIAGHSVAECGNAEGKAGPELVHCWLYHETLAV